MWNKIGSMCLIALVRFYQKLISPIKPKRIKCRFYPTCSRYAIEAVKKYGPVEGTKKTVNRLKRCNQYNRDSCIDYP